MTRREALIRGAGAVVTAGAAVAGGYLLLDPGNGARSADVPDRELRLKNYFADIDFPTANPRISIATGGQGDIERMVRAAVEGLAPSEGMKRFVSKGDVVLIKPNVGFDRAPQFGATTHPEVIRSVLRLCREAGAQTLLVADNPIESPEVCFLRSRIKHAAQVEGATIHLPTARAFRSVSIRDNRKPARLRPDPIEARALTRWPVFYEPLAKATKVIGVAPIKDHNLCSASMNMKNWYGLLGGPRNRLHRAIHATISDLALMMSPTLVIADGTRVMMRSGPTGGRLSDVKPGGEMNRPTIVASVDQVACDAWCYQHLLGRDPAGLAYLELAHRKIAAQTAGGVRRFGECDWQAYKRQGKIVIASV